MVQTEVAERLAAKPGTKIYGAPSAKAAWWANLSMAGNVSRSVFWPVPNVDSSLVTFERHSPLGDESARRLTFDVIDVAFSQRRKMLRKVLSQRFGGSEATERHLSTIGIDPTLRGESLAITDFYRIAEYARGL
jgi:16S rRNA (adenine1518-N6/adenine1519-N6)-dimethyltransferase